MRLCCNLHISRGCHFGHVNTVLWSSLRKKLHSQKAIWAIFKNMLAHICCMITWSKFLLPLFHIYLYLSPNFMQIWERKKDLYEKLKKKYIICQIFISLSQTWRLLELWRFQEVYKKSPDSWDKCTDFCLLMTNLADKIKS